MKYFNQNQLNNNYNIELEEEKEFNNLVDYNENLSNDGDNNSVEGNNSGSQSPTINKSLNEMLEKKRKRSYK